MTTMTTESLVQRWVEHRTVNAPVRCAVWPGTSTARIVIYTRDRLQLNATVEYGGRHYRISRVDRRPVWSMGEAVLA